MIDKVYRLIYISSLAFMGLFLCSIVLGLLFFDNYRHYPSVERIVGLLVWITPFAPIGTLFGTLKEHQSSRKKMTIISCTGTSVLVLMVLIWGMAFAVTLD